MTKKHTILVVDDNDDAIFMLETLFEGKGYNVVTANSGRKALGKIRNNKIDVVLLDIKMPDMDGLEVCRRIKQNDKTKHIPVVFQTGVYGDVKHKVNALELGGDEYITKPLDNDELLARIASMLRIKDLYDQLMKSEKALAGKVEELIALNKKLKETQSELIQAGKMSVMGQMAAEMAHEINNPLGAIKMHVEELLRDIKDKKFSINEAEEALTDIRKSVDNMSSSINHMRIFSKRSDEKHTELDINETIRDSVNMFRKDFKERNIEILENYSDKPLLLLGDKNRLEQLFTNLIINARDAVSNNKGEKIIKIQSKPDKKKLICVKISDNGTGLDDSLKDQMFHPFITTKKEGVGLGLSIVKRIIDEHNGIIKVESKKGKGTSFTLTF